MKPVNRRNFLKTSAASVAGLTMANGLQAATSNNTEIKTDVITRKLGNTGIDIPVVSMGVGRADSPAIIKAAMKLGVNHFDTAHRYQKGNSEKMLGEVLKDYPRESFTIASKITFCKSTDEFFELLDLSLERLQMEYVDILYLHGAWDGESTNNEIMMKALKMAKDKGKAKHIGVSTHKSEPEVIQAAIDSDLYEVVLTAINFKQEHRAAIKEKIALANQKGIGIIGMKVMAGAYLDEEKKVPVNFKAALKWVLEDENIHSTIPSMVNLEQLTMNAEVLKDVSLTSDEKKDLAQLQNQMGLYCNGCSECIGLCKKNLPIPELMRAYMYSYGYSESLKAKDLITSLKIDGNPCNDCITCTTKCVKGFNVERKIADISRLTSTPSEFLT